MMSDLGTVRGDLRIGFSCVRITCESGCSGCCLLCIVLIPQKRGCSETKIGEPKNRSTIQWNKCTDVVNHAFGGVYSCFWKRCK
jgi:hypothetical protein